MPLHTTDKIRSEQIEYEANIVVTSNTQYVMQRQIEVGT